MNGFDFYTPTRIVFGPDTQKRVGELTRAAGGTRVLLVYGGGSAERSGLLGEVRKSLEAAGIPFTEQGGVKPNPLVSGVRSAAAAGFAEKVDFILAVGGGSAIDSAKATGLALAAPGVDVSDIISRKFIPTKTLPVGVVLTMAAAGSETSDSLVLTDEATGIKRGFGGDLIRPVFAVMNPELTYTLPPFQTACGVADIMMHTLERYFTPVKGNELTDRFAEAVLTTTIEYGETAVREPKNYEARSEVMWAGSVSHNNLTGLGAKGDFATHQLGHTLSALFDYAHGATLAAVWGSWARCVMKTDIARFDRYAVKVWGLGGTDAEALALAGIEATERYFQKLGLPTGLVGLGLPVQSEEELRRLAHHCSYGGTRTIGAFRKLAEEDIYQIYRLANH